MQIFLNHGLAMLAVPKTGTTAREQALRQFASIDVRKPPKAKHVTAHRFNRHWRPFLAKLYGAEVETVAVLREPLSRIESWYRYRRGEAREHRTDHLSFEDFVAHVLSDNPPPEARVGAQDAFVQDRDGRIVVDHLFAVETPGPLSTFLAERFGKEIDVKRINVSDPYDVTLSPATRARLVEARAGEFALYRRVAETGHLKGDVSVR